MKRDLNENSNLPQILLNTYVNCDQIIMDQFKKMMAGLEEKMRPCKTSAFDQVQNTFI